MSKTIVKVVDGYGIDIWDNYLKVDVDKNNNTGEWTYSSIVILKDEAEISKAKSVLGRT